MIGNSFVSFIRSYGLLGSLVLSCAVTRKNVPEKTPRGKEKGAGGCKKRSGNNLFLFLLFLFLPLPLLPQKSGKDDGVFDTGDLADEIEIFQSDFSDVEPAEIAAFAEEMFDGAQSPEIDDPLGERSRFGGLAEAALHVDGFVQGFFGTVPQLLLQIG